MRVIARKLGCTQFMVYIVGRTILYKETNTINIQDDIACIRFNPCYITLEAYVVGHKKFNWMESSVHLRDFQQREIQFIPVLPRWFWI